MSLEQAILILEYHQSWRLGNGDKMITPQLLTEALQIAIQQLKELK